jgi:pseudouridine kinase
MRPTEIDQEKRLLVIGAASLDVIGRPQTFPEVGTSNPALVRTAYGGVARNVAENIARLGQPVSLISVVGRDHLGHQILKHTQSAGVDIHACLQVEDFNTAAYLAVQDENGDLYFGLDDMRIIKRLTPRYLHTQKKLFLQSNMIFTDANLSPAALRTLVTMSEKSGIPICADATTTSLSVRLKPFIANIFMLTANRHEAAALLDNQFSVDDQPSALRAAREFVKMGVKVAVVPIAEGGVCYAISEISGHIPAVLTKIVDSTGAGDALTATTIFGLLNDLEIDEAVRLGVTAASLTLAHPTSIIPELSLELLYQHLVI